MRLELERDAHVARVANVVVSIYFRRLLGLAGIRGERTSTAWYSAGYTSPQSESASSPGRPEEHPRVFFPGQSTNIAKVRPLRDLDTKVNSVFMDTSAIGPSVAIQALPPMDYLLALDPGVNAPSEPRTAGIGTL